MTFGKTVNDSTANTHTLLVNASGLTTFAGAVGNSAGLAGLTTDAAGTTDVNGSPVQAATVDFQDDLVLTTNVTISGTAVTFVKTVNSDALATPRTLAVNAGGVTTFRDAVGGVAALASLTTDSAGSTALDGGAVTTTNTQTYHDAVLLGQDTTLTSTGRPATSPSTAPWTTTSSSRSRRPARLPSPARWAESSRWPV